MSQLQAADHIHSCFKAETSLYKLVSAGMTLPQLGDYVAAHMEGKAVEN
jgi:hypothetical protein